MSDNTPLDSCYVENAFADSDYELKLLEMKDYFQKIFQTVPDFCMRIPGRVNLIGEHIDYCGYSVCPMAIKPAIIATVKINADMNIRIVNTDKQYEPAENSMNNIRILANGCSAPLWSDYLICGIKGILDLELVDYSTLRGLNILISGNIPPCAGLSSSSALVCAGALAVVFAFKLNVSKTELAEICAKSERYIGTAGGGMDQAIIFCARKGYASRIFFNPIKIDNIHLPSRGTFVIAQSLVTKNKAASSDFNNRVVECRLASLMLGKKCMVQWKPITVLCALQKELNKNYEMMIKLVEEILNKPSYSKQEVCEILNITEDELDEKFLTANTRHITEFKIRQRALHVFEEAYRVDKFCSACNKQDTRLEELGKLMTESHQSLKELYECSHPQLDQLVSCCLEAGAYGARLTGAGWGGCVVALIDSEKCHEFESAIKIKYYQTLTLKNVDIDDLIFSSKPFSGASVHLL